MLLTLVVLLLAHSDENAVDSRDQILTSVKTAKVNYEQASEAAAKHVLDLLDKDISSAKKKGFADKVQVLQSQRDSFLSENLVPIDQPLVSYYTKTRKARRTMVESFRKAIARAYAIDDEELAQDIALDFNEFRASCNLDWLQAGDSLLRNDSMLSRDGRFELTLTDGGELELSRIDDQPVVIWRAGTKDRGGIRLVMGYDGNLVLRDRGGKPVFATNTSWNEPGKLVLQGDGNLVLLDSDGKPLWGSGSDE